MINAMINATNITINKAMIKVLTKPMIFLFKIIHIAEILLQYRNNYMDKNVILNAEREVES